MPRGWHCERSALLFGAKLNPHEVAFDAWGSKSRQILSSECGIAARMASPKTQLIRVTRESLDLISQDRELIGLGKNRGHTGGAGQTKRYCILVDR
jgi:hypothetical protein